MKYQKIEIRGFDGILAILEAYILTESEELASSQSSRPAIVICPGGAYRMTSDREAEPIALEFLSQGFQVFVLRYAVDPARFPTALTQLASSLTYIRKHAQEWHIDRNKIILAGFSAGGHLAAQLGVEWDKKWLSDLLDCSPEDYRPNVLLLAYPVITTGIYAHEASFQSLLGENFSNPSQLEAMSLEKKVTDQTPPTFIWHTGEDEIVPAENSLLFVEALRKAQVPTEFHLYSFGGHGLALGDHRTVHKEGYGIEKGIQSWLGLFLAWFKRISEEFL